MSNENVSYFSPTEQAVENIPHMLRYWASIVEKDQENDQSKYDFAVLMLVEKNTAPVFCILGSERDESPHPLYVSGALAYCASEMQSVMRIDHD